MTREALRDALTATYDSAGESWRLVAMSDDGGIIPAGIPDGLLQAVIDAVFTADAPDADGLDTAWRVAEKAALGVGVVALRHHAKSVGDYRATWFRPVDPTGGGTVIAESADGPAEALLALAAALRDRVS